MCPTVSITCHNFKNSSTFATIKYIQHQASYKLKILCTLYSFLLKNVLCFLRSRNCILVLSKFTREKKCLHCKELNEYLSQLHQQIKGVDEINVKEELPASPMETEGFDDSHVSNDDFADKEDYINKMEVKAEEKPNQVISFKSKTKLKNMEKRKQTSFTSFTDNLSSCNVTISAREKVMKKKWVKVNCQLCGVTVKEHLLQSHIEKCQNPDNYNLTCPQEGCLVKFKYKKELKKHVLECHNIILEQSSQIQIQIHCPFCETVFGPRSNISTHMEACHVNERDNPVYIEFVAQHRKTDVCIYCGKVFHNKPAFNLHMRENHPEEFSTVKCHICGKGYRHQSSLKEHLRRHEECESLCVECGKTLPNKVSLDDHIKHNHPKEHVSCPECFKFFPNPSKLARHVRYSHLDIRMYPCSMCDKSFKKKDKLMQHVTAIHDKLKPFLCEMCSFDCARLDNLNLHRRKSHGKTAAENFSKTTFLAMVERGEHPHYDKDKLQLLLRTKHR